MLGHLLSHFPLLIGYFGPIWAPVQHAVEQLVQVVQSEGARDVGHCLADPNCHL